MLINVVFGLITETLPFWISFFWKVYVGNRFCVFKWMLCPETPWRASLLNTQSCTQRSISVKTVEKPLKRTLHVQHTHATANLHRSDVQGRKQNTQENSPQRHLNAPRRMRRARHTVTARVSPMRSCYIYWQHFPEWTKPSWLRLCPGPTSGGRFLHTIFRICSRAHVRDYSEPARARET